MEFNNKFKLKYFRILFLTIFFSNGVFGQKLDELVREKNAILPDTITLSLEDAENLLIKHNLLLIAQKMNIEQSKAQALQSRLWDNPNLYMETNPYNSQNYKFFHYTKASQKDSVGNYTGNEIIVAVDQVIRTAGKRSNLVKLNKINAQIAENVYYDLMRSLKYTLRSDYYLMLQYQQGIGLLQSQLSTLDDLISKISSLVSKGAVAMKDQYRLQALSFEIENTIRNLVVQRLTLESEMKTIIGFAPKITLKLIKDTTRLKLLTLPNLDSLGLVLIDNRYDLKAADATVRAAKANLSLQRSLAYPDLDILANFTEYSNYLPNYFGLGVKTTLPFFNRNQGNIKMAKFNIQAQQSTYENQVNDALNGLSASYNQFLKFQSGYTNFNKNFAGNYEQFFKDVSENFIKRNISLLEFVDYFESYKQVKLASYNIEQDFLQAKEQLNFNIGTERFR